MIVKNKEELKVIKESGRRLGLILKALAAGATPGKTGLYFEDLVWQLVKEYEVRPSFFKYQNFPAALCLSVNDYLVHGLPGSTPLKIGDLVGFDFGVEYPAKDGLYTDSALTVGVGELIPEAENLLKVTNLALVTGIKAAKVGGHTGDIGAAVQEVIEGAGLGLVRQLVGHGVGKAVHEPPQVPNFGKADQGAELVEGMVIAIEPMATLGNGKVKLHADGFSYVSEDGTLAAHAEHTVLLTKKGPQILTK